MTTGPETLVWEPQLRAAADCEACSVGLYATCEPLPWCYHEHDQTLIDYPFDWVPAHSRSAYFLPPLAEPAVIGVDRLVVPLLQTLWSAGVRTWVSCQGAEQVMAGYVSHHQDDHATAMDVLTSIFPARFVKPTVSDAGRFPSGRIAFPALDA